MASYYRRRRYKRRGGRRIALRRTGKTGGGTRKPYESERIVLVDKPRRRKRGKHGRTMTRTAMGSAFIAVIAIALTLAVNLVSGRTPKIDITDVSEMKVSFDTVVALKTLAERTRLPFDELWAVYMTENRFFPQRTPKQDINTLERLYIVNYSLIRNKYGEKNLSPYINIFKTLLNEIKCFPVREKISEAETDSASVDAGYMYGDGFKARAGLFDAKNARHYGIDIYDRENIPGRLIAVSVTDGTVEDAGYNNTDGYYVIITADSGNKYYYYHLDSLPAGLGAGMRVAAGQTLGGMGASGSACLGVGLCVRLHVGVKIKSELRHEMWINPYIFLRLIEGS